MTTMFDRLSAMATEYENNAAAIRRTLTLLNGHAHAAAVDALPTKLEHAIAARKQLRQGGGSLGVPLNTEAVQTRDDAAWAVATALWQEHDHGFAMSDFVAAVRGAGISLSQTTLRRILHEHGARLVVGTGRNARWEPPKKSRAAKATSTAPATSWAQTRAGRAKMSRVMRRVWRERRKAEKTANA